MTQLTFLPAIMQGVTPPPFLGSQIEHHHARSVVKWVVPGRQYQIPVKWRDVESVKGVYNWSSYDPDFNALFGNRLTVGIKVVPTWARLWKDYVASPPAQQYYPNLANFIIKLIDRYHIDAVELFNEPDVDLITNAQYAEYFGAWCLSRDWYDGGLLYGACLNSIYNVIHDVYPSVRIIAGALIGSDSSLLFLQGAIDNKLKCDAISFHKYIMMGGDFNSAFNFGLEIQKKIPKPQILSETSVLANVDSQKLQQIQADYLKYLRNNNTIASIQWYTLANNNWMNSDLIKNNMSTLAYEEFIKES